MPGDGFSSTVLQTRGQIFVILPNGNLPSEGERWRILVSAMLVIGFVWSTEYPLSYSSLFFPGISTHRRDFLMGLSDEILLGLLDPEDERIKQGTVKVSEGSIVVQVSDISLENAAYYAAVIYAMLKAAGLAIEKAKVILESCKTVAEIANVKTDTRMKTAEALKKEKEAVLLQMEIDARNFQKKLESVDDNAVEVVKGLLKASVGQEVSLIVTIDGQ